MSSALSTAVNGVHTAVAQATHAAASIVKASSTGKNIDSNLVKLKQSSTDIAADAAVIKVTQQDQQALLDITV